MTVYDLIAVERERAAAMRDNGELRFVASDADCPDMLRLAALAEELGEVARALHDGDELALGDELVHLAGVACAWREVLP
jgi:NTP pyrophosphatase (non-canonical NTP hydrolase)